MKFDDQSNGGIFEGKMLISGLNGKLDYTSFLVVPDCYKLSACFR
jgi:hypothetical protein